MAGTRGSWGKIQKKEKKYYPSYIHPEDILKTRHKPVGGFTTRMDAEAWLAAEHRAIELGVWVAPEDRRIKAEAESITVRPSLDEYHRIIQRPPHEVIESTIQQYQRVVNNRILAPCGTGAFDHRVTRLAEMSITELTKSDVHMWWDGICDAYSTPETNHKAYVRLRAAFAEAKQRGMIPDNPVEIAGVSRRVAKRDTYLPTDEELQKILDEMRDDWKLLTSLILFHGLRIGEALALEQHHIRMDPETPVPLRPRYVVQVEQNAQRLTGPYGCYMNFQAPKTEAGFRQVPILEIHSHLVEEHFRKHLPRSTTTVQTSEGDREVRLLTTTDTGRPIMDTSYRSVLGRVKEATGVSKKIGPHSGRRWCITRLAEVGATPKEIGKFLGQRDLDTILDVYMKAREARVTTLMRAVSDTLAPA